MGYLSNPGRIFYGIAIACMGLQAIYAHELPYILPLPQHFSPAGATVIALIFGALFTVAGACLIFRIAARKIALLFGCLLLCMFCFYYIPYEFLTSANYLHLEEWENAEKELALAGGALVIADCFAATSENKFYRFPGKLVPLGAVFFSVTLISFGILHFLFATDAATLVPAWIPYHLFWIYFAGIALIGSGAAILLKIKPGLTAALCGLMIFLWFILLHIPRVIAAPADAMAGEITSAFLALAYSGTAFVISGEADKKALR